MKHQPCFYCLVVLLSFLCAAETRADNNVDPEPAVTITGNHVVVNDDDTNYNQLWDKSDIGTIDNLGLKGGKDSKIVHDEPLLVKFIVTATPVAGKPGKLTVTKTGGNVKLWTDQIKTSKFELPVNSSKTSVTFWVEGQEPTTTFKEAGFDATYTINTDTAKASIRYGITRADAHIDSDNDAEKEPIFTVNDDQIEFSTKLEDPGKILRLNNGDVDSDGVPDSLDGLGLQFSDASATVVGLNLVPMKIKLETPYSKDRATVRFAYPASIPQAGKDISGEVPYQITKRGIRLWSVDGHKRKSGQNIPEGVPSNGVQSDDVGRFVPSGVDIPWTALAWNVNPEFIGSSVPRELIIYLEYVDIPNGLESFTKEDIVYTIKEDEVPESEKGYEKVENETTRHLTEKESPDGVCVQLVPNRNAMITEVSFSGNHTLINDDDSKTFSAPHYTANVLPTESAPRRFPTAYTMSTGTLPSKPTVEMKFKMTVADGDEKKIAVMAVGTDGVILPERSFVLKNGVNEFTYGPAVGEGKPFPDRIRFYGPGIGAFKFNWQIKVGEGEFIPFDTTSHRIYLTAGTPACTRGNRETLFYYACNQANNDSGLIAKNVIHKIWRDFDLSTTYKDMYRINSETGNMRTGVNEKLLFVVPGSTDIPESTITVCNGWSDFLANVIRVHSYTAEKKDVESRGMVLPAGVVDKGANAWLVPSQIIAADGRSVSTGPGGIAHGQGNDIRRADTIWRGHTIVYAEGEYYDPSYGIGKCTSQADYESKATSGYRSSKLQGSIFPEYKDYFWGPTASPTLVYLPAKVP